MKKKGTKQRWMKDTPQCCQLCKNPFIGNTFVNGKTGHGLMVLMCVTCHEKVGVGLGEGKGQRYRLTDGMLLQGGA